MRDWRGWQRGLLARAGGMHDQDADWLDDMIRIDNYYAEEFNKLVEERDRYKH